MKQGAGSRSPAGHWRLLRHEAARVGSLPVPVYVALFTLALWVDQQSAISHGPAGYWLSGGVLMAAILQLHRRHATIVLIVTVIISLIGGAVASGWGILWLVNAAINLGSAVLAVALARRVSGAALDLCRPRRLMRFAMQAAIPASAVSAGLHYGIAGMTSDLGIAASLFDVSVQFIAHLLSLLLVVPVLLMLAQRRQFESMSHMRRLELAGQLALLIAATAVAFLQTAVPLLFLAFPPLLFLALRQPPKVVGVALIIMAGISAAATGAGYGPVHMLPIMKIVGLEALSPTLQRLSLYNLFLTSVVVAILPVSSMMNERRRIAARLKLLTAGARKLALQATDALKILQAERNANASKEAFYQNIVELMPAFLIVKDARNGSFVLMNSATTGALGIDPSACLGKTVWDVFPDEEAEASAAEDRVVIRTRSVVTDVAAPITTAAGDLKYYTTRKVAVFDDKGPAYIVTAGQDVTEQVEAQIALKLAVEAAEQASSAKSQFLANMSHELRTPLNGVIAMADMLFEIQADDRSRLMAGTIVESGRMLERVINDILDVAKIEAGQMNLESEPFDLSSTVIGVSNLHAAAATAKGIALECTIDPAASGVYLGDKTRVGQIVSNLLSNAVKFTAHGVVKVSVRPGGSGVRILVSDTGPGFDRATGRRLFERFEQADVSMSRRHGGTGLGLSICRSFTEMMGGRISVRSLPDVGTLFVVNLPLARALESADEPVRTEPSAAAGQGYASNIRILFADDHEVNRTVVAMILEPLGVDLTMVENGQEAVDAAGNSEFDLILMDVQMPVMDGLTATRKIRKMEGSRGLARTPIISLTANAMPDDVKRSLDAGSDLHLPKPIRPADLVTAVAKLMARNSENSDIVEAA